MKVSLSRFHGKRQTESDVTLEMLLKKFTKTRWYKTPTRKQLLQSDDVMLYRYQSENGRITIMASGYALCEYRDGEKMRATVIPLEEFEFAYESVTGIRQVVALEEYKDTPCLNILLMMQEIRAIHNTDSRENAKVKIHLEDFLNQYTEWLSQEDFVDKLLQVLEPCNEKELLIHRLQEAMKKLTVKQQEAIKRYYEDNLTQEKIAEELGISRSAVEDRLEGALTKLRKVIDVNI